MESKKIQGKKLDRHRVGEEKLCHKKPENNKTNALHINMQGLITHMNFQFFEILDISKHW